MKKWGELSKQTLEIMEERSFRPTSNASEGLIKAGLEAGDRMYLDSEELRQRAMAYVEVADWLDLRASENKD